MTKALFKKQIMEVFSWLFLDRKSGKSRSKNGVILYAVLYLLIFGFLGAVFLQMALMLCQPLVQSGFGWLYFALMGLLGVAMGVFGSVFSTYSSLYLAKDNDLLLSMPIPASRILAARLFGVYAMGLLYELIVMLPAVIVYYIKGEATVAGGIFAFFLPLILSVFVLTLSCILGWLVALVGGKLKNKNIVTVILSLAFIAGYYILYSKAYSIMQAILASPQTVGDTVRSWLFLFYHMGRAAEGNVLSMLFFVLVTAALFGVVYALLSRSFIRLATASRGGAKVKYKEKAARAGSADSALLYKEWKRFSGSPTYMLNCGLGSVVMLVAAVVLLIKREAAVQMLSEMLTGYEAGIPVLAAIVLCLAAAMNDITAPSVSLEGKNLWLVQVFPVSAWQVLQAKVKLHLALTMPFVLLLGICAGFALSLSFLETVLVLAAGALFVWFSALFGLVLNLKMPNLNWVNEAVPVKQSMGVMLALFGGWVLILLVVGGCFALSQAVGAAAALLAAMVILAVLCAVLHRYLRKKGSAVLESL